MSEPQDGKKYWRSLERLWESPAVQEELQQLAGHEFPEGAAERPDAMSRRTMMTLMSASFALAGLEGCRRPVEKIVPYVDAPESVIPGIPKHYASTLPFLTSNFGVVVESHEGRPSKIEGNELHPSSGGAAHSWTQASILELYDADRSRSVMTRDAETGDLTAATWDDFWAAWQELATAFEANGGEGLAVIAPSHASPTLGRLARAFRERYPNATGAIYDAVGDENLFVGARIATGQSVRPVYHLDKARTIVALDADFLFAESESVAMAKGFAASRRMKSSSDDMNRLYVVESTLSVTGSNADHRLRLRSSEIAAFTAALAEELAAQGLALENVPTAGASLDASARAKAKVMAADLAAAQGDAVVLAGRRQPPAVHALVLQINQALGALGSTVTLSPVEHTAYGSTESLGRLVGEINDGKISTLIVLDGDPVYNAPADLAFGEAYAKVATTIHLSRSVDETSQASTWHLPRSTFLESWGDGRSADGTLSVVQPLIAPLFDSRSAIELVHRLTTGEDKPGHDLVQETWAAVLGSDGFDKVWRQTLHDGVLAADATGQAPAPEVSVDAQAVADAYAQLAQPVSEGLEVAFHPSASAFDGRFANISWLQELPDPVTKMVWDNAAWISPRTAKELGLETGDLVRLDRSDRSLEVPVFVLPGQADGTVALSLGYGRTAAGRVGDGVGYDAYRLRDSTEPHFSSGWSLEKVAGHHDFSQTQHHWEMEGRELARDVTLAEYRENSDPLANRYGPEKTHQLFGDHDYSTGYQWGMSIDLNSCIGCNACIVACQSENNIPVVGKKMVSKGREMHWLRVDRYFVGGEDDPEVAFQPVPCMHCENAPCEQVCPVAATVHDREGINAMVYNRCIGTRYCSNNCPYKVRRFNFFNFTKDTPELLKMAMNPDVTVRSRGVMEKCTYCTQRINEAKITAKKEGRTVKDGEIKTACQQTCPTEAIVFGDLNNPESALVERKGQDLDYALVPDLNNRPRTSYLAKLRNPNEEWENA